jgi:hypothetical protein
MPIKLATQTKSKDDIKTLVYQLSTLCNADFFIDQSSECWHITLISAEIETQINRTTPHELCKKLNQQLIALGNKTTIDSIRLEPGLRNGIDHQHVIFIGSIRLHFQSNAKLSTIDPATFYQMICQNLFPGKKTALIMPNTQHLTFDICVEAKGFNSIADAESLYHKIEHTLIKSDELATGYQIITLSASCDPISEATTIAQAYGNRYCNDQERTRWQRKKDAAPKVPITITGSHFKTSIFKPSPLPTVSELKMEDGVTTYKVIPALIKRFSNDEIMRTKVTSGDIQDIKIVFKNSDAAQPNYEFVDYASTHLSAEKSPYQCLAELHERKTVDATFWSNPNTLFRVRCSPVGSCPNPIYIEAASRYSNT